jgi:hypothetical protein
MRHGNNIRLIVISIFVGIAIIVGIVFAVNEYNKNPFSFQEKVTLGVKYQEYSPKSPELKDNQRQVRIVLPGEENPEIHWVAKNTGCMVLTSTRAVVNAMPIRVVDTATEYEFLAGEPLFISCIDDARIIFNRTIPLPTPTPEPAPTDAPAEETNP